MTIPAEVAETCIGHGACRAWPGGVRAVLAALGRLGSSMQEELEAVLLPLLQADSATLVSAGREDKDVRMLGTGRPFVLQVVNAKAPRPSECATAAPWPTAAVAAAA